MKVAIIGGGASGIMAALYLQKLNPEFKITIFEQNDRIAKKILKTGNGRCNISNLDMQPKYYNHPDFINRIYQKVNPKAVMVFFKQIGLLTKTDSSTRLYPYSENASTVVDVLRLELSRTNINVLCDNGVKEVQVKEKFIVRTNTYHNTFDYVIFASGSIAQENTNGYELLKNLGLKVTELTPGLTPLKVKEDIKSLQGIRVKCKAKVLVQNQEIYEEAGELLFKEQGLSGVLMLNLSRYAHNGSTISLDLFSEYPDIENYINGLLKEKAISEVLSGLLPKMLVFYLIKNYGDNPQNILKAIRNLKFTVTGNYGFNQGQIVLGGIDINEINDNFEVRKIPNMYICGEVLDIDGASGGYNLHFAWTSGIVAAKAIFEKNLK